MTTREGRTTYVRSQERQDPGHAARAMSLYIPRGRQMVEKQCPNADCPEYGHTQELAAFEEFGRQFLVRDEDIYCPECGTEMTDVL